MNWFMNRSLSPPLIQVLLLSCLGIAFLSAWPQFNALSAIAPPGHPVSAAFRLVSQLLLFAPVALLQLIPERRSIQSPRWTSWINALLLSGIMLYAYLPAPFFDYVWDVFLIESIFVFLISRICLVIEGREDLFPWPMRVLLFKLMLCMGIVKFLHGMPEWRSGLALKYFWQNQPMPGHMAWCLAQLPDFMQQIMAAFVFLVEVPGPFLIFGGGKSRRLFFFLNLMLQFGIFISGNYGFFNILTVVLSISLWDMPKLDALQHGRSSLPPLHPLLRKIVLCACSVILAGWCFTSLWYLYRCVFPGPKYLHETSWIFLGNEEQRAVPAPIRTALKVYAAAKISNPYALFGMIPKYRLEIGLEGSADGVEWKKYQFKIKPDKAQTAPIWYAPHHWRLDHQMYYESFRIRDPALHEKYSYFLGVRWMPHFLHGLLTQKPGISRLLENNPFPEHPPLRLRFTYTFYEFNNRDEFLATQKYWKTTPARSGKFFEGILDLGNIHQLP